MKQALLYYASKFIWLKNKIEEKYVSRIADKNNLMVRYTETNLNVLNDKIMFNCFQGVALFLQISKYCESRNLIWQVQNALYSQQQKFSKNNYVQWYWLYKTL